MHFYKVEKTDWKKNRHLDSLPELSSSRGGVGQRGLICRHIWRHRTQILETHTVHWFREQMTMINMSNNSYKLTENIWQQPENRMSEFISNSEELTDKFQAVVTGCIIDIKASGYWWKLLRKFKKFSKYKTFLQIHVMFYCAIGEFYCFLQKTKSSSISHRLRPLLDSVGNTLFWSHACIRPLKFACM